MPLRALRPAARGLVRAARAGFTLIELLAVMLIIGILMAFLVPQIPAAIDRANVTACKANMRSIAEGLLAYRSTYGRMPSGSGVGFFSALVSDKVWEATETNTKRLTCPGIEDNALVPFQDGIPRADWFADAGAVGPGYSSYAGRNQKEHPIMKFPISGKQALVADDNDGTGGNHRTATVVLWGDMSVRELKLVELQNEGIVDEDMEYIPVGAESPVEALRMLSIVD